MNNNTKKTKIPLKHKQKTEQRIDVDVDLNNESEIKSAIPKRHPASTDSSTENRLSRETNIESHKGTKLQKKDAWSVSLLVFGGFGIIGGAVCLLIALMQTTQITSPTGFPIIPSENRNAGEYSDLTGEQLANGVDKNAPTYCIQTPNGTDGARPQAGLTQAGVIFEAIAEAGITRFAAIYQNPTSTVIGPIRSLRLYYLDWDTPFDCTIVHAGGADDALRAVSSDGYKDLSEDYSYMYRGTYGQRLWNNLFTTASNLQQYSDNHNYKESNIQGFARMTPDESAQKLANSLSIEKLEITHPTTKNTSELIARVPEIKINFGGFATFNTHYVYDINNNVYLRSYQTGYKHEVYKCPGENLGEKNPEDVCELVQMAPSVVIAMIVSERRASDNYHEVITTTGSGKAYIFQNGDVIEGTWNKPTKDDQIRFTDDNNHEIKLAPGQTFISAIPSYGSIEY